MTFVLQAEKMGKYRVNRFGPFGHKIAEKSYYLDILEGKSLNNAIIGTILYFLYFQVFSNFSHSIF